MALAGVAALALAPAAGAQAPARGVELISPPDSGGYDSEWDGLDRAGRHVYFGVRRGSPLGARKDGGAIDFFGAERGSSGWEGTWLTPYCSGAPSVFAPGAACGPLELDNDRFVGGDGGRIVYTSQNPTDAGDSNFFFNVFQGAADAVTQFSTLPDGSPPPGSIATTPLPVTTPDLGAVAFLTGDALLPIDTDDQGDVYMEANGALRLMSSNASGETAPCPVLGGCAMALGADLLGATSYDSIVTHPVSDDGARVFLTTQKQLLPDDTDLVDDVYVNDGGTIRLLSGTSSASPASFEWAATDGSRAFITTAAPLTGDDQDTAKDVYAVDAATGSPTLVSSGTTNDPASFVTASADGSHVVYWTTEALAGAPDDGAPKLYVWDSGTTRSVGSLPAGDPLTDPEPVHRPIRSTSDGSTIAFSTTAQLRSEDTNAVSDVYAWIGAGLRLVSQRQPDATTGDASIVGPSQFAGTDTPGGHAMTDDGSRIYFDSAAGLRPEDVDGRVDVYEWRDGTLSLVTPGNDGADDIYADNTSDGADVFYSSNASLVPGDTDGGELDVYDARVGGGFDAGGSSSTVGAPPSAGGPAPAPSPPQTGTLTPQPPGNPAAATPPQQQARPHEPSGHVKLTENVAAASGAMLSLQVSAPGPGLVTIQLTRGVARRAAIAAVLATGRQRFAGAGSRRVAVRLSTAGRATLVRAGRLRVAAILRFVPDTGAARTSRSRLTLVSDAVALIGRSVATRRGRARATLAVPNRGRVRVTVRSRSGRHAVLARGSTRSRHAGRVRVRLALSRAGRRATARHHHVPAQSRITFESSDGARLRARIRASLVTRGRRR